jgi:hypothetical protein
LLSQDKNESANDAEDENAGSDIEYAEDENAVDDEEQAIDKPEDVANYGAEDDDEDGYYEEEFEDDAEHDAEYGVTRERLIVKGKEEKFHKGSTVTDSTLNSAGYISDEF